MGYPGPLLGRDDYDDWPVAGPNPNPLNFKILREEEVGRFLIVELRYPDCTNFEGRKILVYEGMTLELLHRCQRIDPHFQEKPNISTFGCSLLIARFIPTKEGWSYAQSFCRGLTGIS